MSATKKWCMAGCFALLCLIMTSIWVRLFTVQIVMKRLHIDNGITRMIVSDNEELRAVNTKDIPIKWNELYPFKEEETRASQFKKESAVAIVEGKIHGKIASVQEKVSKWTSNYLVGYGNCAENYNAYKKMLHWDIMPRKGYNSVVEIEDGQLAEYQDRADMAEKIKNVTKLAQFCKNHDAAFFYVSAPGKIMRRAAKYKDLDFSNANADAFFAGLKENGVEYIDIRDYEEAEGLTTKDLFFRTDHHWLPEAGLWATGIIARHLNEEGLIKSDVSLLNPSKWDKEILKNFALGSRGKKVTLARTKPDDITIFHPKFPTHLHLEIPNKDIASDGDFDILYDKKQLKKVDYYHGYPYEAYSWSNMPFKYIRNEEAVNDKTVLLLRNSFASVVLPFLSLQFRHSYELDLRVFSGSVEEVIRQKKPDVVIVLYHQEQLPSKINYEAHNSLWDFR